PAVIVHAMEQIGLNAAGEIVEVKTLAAAGQRALTPQNARDAAAQKIDQTNLILMGEGGRTVNLDRLAPAVAALIDPQRELAMIHEDQVGYAIAVHVADQDLARIISAGKARTIAHVNARAPVPQPKIGPVFKITVVNQHDVPQAIAAHVGETHA